MSLARHIDPDQIIDTLHIHSNGGHRHRGHSRAVVSSSTPYSTRYASTDEISKFKIPKDGAPAEAVHQMLKDELDLDGRPNLNLAR
jgi:glutamate decarboxylase